MGAAAVLAAGSFPAFAQLAEGFGASYAAPVAAASLAPWMEAWVGAGMSNRYQGAWTGGVVALNDARNVWTDGVVARFEGMVGHYRYGTTNVAGGVAGSIFNAGSVYIGYRKKLDNTTITGYVGADVMHTETNDLTARARGTHAGVKFLGEMYTRFNPSMDLYAQANYSTMLNKWYTLMRPGFLIQPNFWIGPEFQAMGNQGTLGSAAYSEWRVGGFVHLQLPNQQLGDIIIAGGYKQPFRSNGGSNGFYAQISANLKF